MQVANKANAELSRKYTSSTSTCKLSYLIEAHCNKFNAAQFSLPFHARLLIATQASTFAQLDQHVFRKTSLVVWVGPDCEETKVGYQPGRHKSVSEWCSYTRGE